MATTTTTTTTEPITCPPVGDDLSLFGGRWMEQPVIFIFRVWHIIFLCIGGLLALVILICCIFRVRIPRTKQDIEADFKRKKITKKFRKQLDKLTIEDTNLKAALERVNERVSNEAQENGAALTSDTPATTPGSTRSLANVILTPNSVPPTKVSPTIIQPETSQSSAEDGESMTSAQTARIKLRKALLKAKQQRQDEDDSQVGDDG